MKPLRRTTTPNAAPLQGLMLPSTCDQCGKNRGHGDHSKCSKKRQALNSHKWES